jgi:hypothetical protein
MNKCSYWNINGLRASSADNTGAKAWEGNVFRLYGVGNVTLRRLLVVRPNRTCPNGSLPYCNSHALLLEDSHHVLLEESEVYDYHRHGVSVFKSRYVTVRRCYANPRGAASSEGGGNILYGSSDSIFENFIGENVYGINIAGGTLYDGGPGGYNNKILGTISLTSRYGSTVRARRFGGPVLPLAHNLLKDSVYIRAQGVGVFARGAADTRLENVSVFDTVGDAGVIADEDLSEGAPCSANPDGCSLSAKNLLSVGNSGMGMQVKTSVVKSWSLESSNLWDNGGGNFPTSETPGDDAGSIRRSRSVAPSGMGAGGCLVWVPDGSPMKGAGAGGARHRRVHPLSLSGRDAHERAPLGPDHRPVPVRRGRGRRERRPGTLVHRRASALEREHQRVPVPPVVLTGAGRHRRATRSPIGLAR